MVTCKDGMVTCKGFFYFAAERRKSGTSTRYSRKILGNRGQALDILGNPRRAAPGFPGVLWSKRMKIRREAPDFSGKAKKSGAKCRTLAGDVKKCGA